LPLAKGLVILALMFPAQVTPVAASRLFTVPQYLLLPVTFTNKEPLIKAAQGRRLHLHPGLPLLSVR
jgi:hypothetical protein